MKSTDELAFLPIGVVHNNFNEQEDHRIIKNQSSIIEVYRQYVDALLAIEQNDYLDIIYYFHRSTPALQADTCTNPGVLRGVFGSRKPKRPNLIGCTTVKLLERKDHILLVEGLDAINGSPVLDIKTIDTSMFAHALDNNPVHQSKLKSSPRIDIHNDIFSGNTDALMIKAAQTHGHYCPGLALGIMAAVSAMKQLNALSDGMEDLLAITETNNCFADGVQFVTGCSFGNNALIFKDLGKTAFTLTRRDGKGIRVAAKPDAQSVIREAFPDHQQLYQKVIVEQNHEPSLMAKYKKTSLDRAFGTLSLRIDELLSFERVDAVIPPYAKTHDSVMCKDCKESIMKSRSIQTAEDHYHCLSCAGHTFHILDGNGIRKSNCG